MIKKIICHHNMIGHEINESLNFYTDDKLDRTIYCRKLHQVTAPHKDVCDNCPYRVSFEQGNGIECAWEDIVLEDMLIPFEKRYQEYARVDQLIKKGILLPPERLTELHVKNKEYDPERWYY